MEGIPSPRSSDKEGLLSCWGCLKLKLPWINKRGTTRRYKSSRQIRSSMVGKSSAAGYRYDPLSYAQNFDEGTSWDHDEDDQEFTRRGFSARFVAPLSKPLQDE